jgi:hypothetical protein
MDPVPVIIPFQRNRGPCRPAALPALLQIVDLLLRDEFEDLDSKGDVSFGRLPPQQVRQLGYVRSDPPCLIARALLRREAERRPVGQCCEMSAFGVESGVRRETGKE